MHESSGPVEDNNNNSYSRPIMTRPYRTRYQRISGRRHTWQPVSLQNITLKYEVSSYVYTSYAGILYHPEPYIKAVVSMSGLETAHLLVEISR